MTHQILVATGSRTICVSGSDIASIAAVKEKLYDAEGIPTEEQLLSFNDRPITEKEFANVMAMNSSFVVLRMTVRGGCVGGKGGFGSLLRSARSNKKTTNFGSCRDLNGRRLRDTENERRVAEFNAQREQREQQEREAREQRAQQRAEQEAPQVEVHQTRKEIVANVQESLSKGLLARREREQQLEKQREKKKRNEPVDQHMWADMGLDELSDETTEPETKRQRTSDESEHSTSDDSDGASTASTTDSAIPAKKGEEALLTATTTTTTTTTSLSVLTPSKDVHSTSTSSITTATTTTTTSKTSNEDNPDNNKGGMKRPHDKIHEPIDLLNFNTAQELAALGLDTLKAELTRLGLKCGGNLTQRAERLWATKGLTKQQYDPSWLAAPTSSKSGSQPNKKQKR